MYLWKADIKFLHTHSYRYYPVSLLIHEYVFLISSFCAKILMDINMHAQRGEKMCMLNGWPFEPLDSIEPDGIGGGGGPTPG